MTVEPTIGWKYVQRKFPFKTKRATLGTKPNIADKMIRSNSRPRQSIVPHAALSDIEACKESNAAPNAVNIPAGLPSDNRWVNAIPESGPLDSTKAVTFARITNARTRIAAFLVPRPDR